MKPAKLNKTTFKPFNFLNFGNLYFYNKNQNNWYFYFNTLLSEYERNPPNPAYARMANRIGEEAKSKLNSMSLITKQGDNDLEFLSYLEEISELLAKGIAYEQKNELLYIQKQKQAFDKIFPVKGESESIEKIRSLYDSFNPEENFDYSKLILLINYFLQGSENTRILLETEKQHLDEMQSQLEEIDQSRQNKISGLAKARHLDQQGKDELERRSRATAKRKRTNLYLQKATLIDQPNFKRLHDLKTSDVLIGKWITEHIEEILNDPKILKKIRDILEEKINFQNYKDVDKEIRSLLIKEVTAYATKNINLILSQNIMTDQTDAIINDLVSNYSEVLDLDIAGLYDNFGLHGKTLKYFNDNITNITTGLASATGLYDAVEKFRKEIVLKKKRFERTSEEKEVMKILGLKKTRNGKSPDEFSDLIVLIDKLQSLKNKDAQDIEKINKEGFLLGKDEEGEEIRIQLIIKDDICTLTEDSKEKLKKVKIGNQTFDNFFGNMNYKNVKTLISSMKRKASIKIRDLFSRTIIMQKIPQQYISKIEKGLAPITVSVGGPTYAEVKQGFQQNFIKAFETKSVWTGKLNVKNDFITVQVDAPLDTFVINFDGIVRDSMKKKIDKINRIMQENYREINNTLVSQIQSDMKDISKNKDFLDYNKQSDQFFNLYKQYQEKVKAIEESLEASIKDIKQLKKITDDEQKVLESLDKQRQEYMKQLKESLYISSTMKTYNSYQNDIGFVGGSLGPNLLDQLETLEQLFNSAGFSIPKDTYEWLIAAIINCSPESVVGEKYKDTIETYLGSLAIFSLFNEGGAELKILANKIEEGIDASNINILHLYGLNGLYYPGSFVLQQVKSNVDYMKEKIKDVTKKRQANIKILNTINMGDIPNRGEIEDKHPWETVRKKAIGSKYHKVNLKVVFMAGLIGTVQDLQNMQKEIVIPT